LIAQDKTQNTHVEIFLSALPTYLEPKAEKETGRRWRSKSGNAICLKKTAPIVDGHFSGAGNGKDAGRKSAIAPMPVGAKPEHWENKENGVEPNGPIFVSLKHNAQIRFEEQVQSIAALDLLIGGRQGLAAISNLKISRRRFRSGAFPDHRLIRTG
jgi:hypothetical protein